MQVAFRSAAVLLVAGAVSCDDLDVGRKPPPTGEPELVRLMIQDADRGVATDLLAADAAPAVIGHVVQVRLVFSHRLDPATVDAKLLDEEGLEVPARRFYDPTGTPAGTADLFYAPYGPAVVLLPEAAFVPEARYRLAYARGAERETYSFAAEPLAAIGDPPAPARIAPDEPLRIALNAPFTATASAARVLRADSSTVAVILASDEEDEATLAIAPAAASWAPGAYTFAVTQVASRDNPDAAPLDLEGTFEVVAP